MRSAIIWLWALTLSVCSLAAENYIEGQHYERVSPEVKTAAANGVEVVELFWYGCPHCFDFEPAINQWLENKPDYVEFRRIPAVFNKTWVPHARAYFTAEILGVLDRIHPLMFDALHVKRQKIMTEASIKQFFLDNGVGEKDFDATYNSFAVDTKTRQAMVATRDYGITGVPSLVVNGRFWTSARLSGDFDGMLKVVEFLADKENTR